MLASSQWVELLVAEQSNLYLKFSKVPEYPFLGTPFQVTISLSDDKGKIPDSVEDLPLHLTLVDSKNHLDDYSHIMESLSGPYRFDSQGRCKLKIHFTKLSAECENRIFVLHARCDSTCATSSNMTSVRYQLRCDYSQFANSPPPVIWFKDRGGKRNCVKVPVRLVSSSGENVVGLTVPIHVELVYSDGEPVPDQTILEMNRESRLLTIGPNGECQLRVRIREVSQRHKGKLFALKISPNVFKDPNVSDISSVVTFTIDVRSKISNSSVTSSLSAGFPIASTNPSRQKRIWNESYSCSPNPVTISAIGTLHPPSLPSAQMEQRKSPKRSQSSSPQSSPISFSTPLQTVNELEQEFPSLSLPPLSHQPSTSKLEMWAFNAVYQLEQIRWLLLGQEANGGQPIYQMSNPNPIIDSLVSQYHLIQAENEEMISKASRASDSPNSLTDSDNDFDHLPPLPEAEYPLNSLSFPELWNLN